MLAAASRLLSDLVPQLDPFGVRLGERYFNFVHLDWAKQPSPHKERVLKIAPSWLLHRSSRLGYDREAGLRRKKIQEDDRNWMKTIETGWSFSVVLQRRALMQRAKSELRGRGRANGILCPKIGGMEKESEIRLAAFSGTFSACLLWNNPIKGENAPTRGKYQHQESKMPRVKKTTTKRATKTVRGGEKKVKKRVTRASTKPAQPKKRKSRVAQADDDSHVRPGRPRKQ